MTRKVNIPTTSRDIYFTPAGDDLWSGASPETAVTTPAEAIVRVNALVPPPAQFNPASINASQTGVSLEGITMPFSTTANCRFAAIVTEDSVSLGADSNQILEWGALVNRAPSGINFAIDSKENVTGKVNTMVVGSDAATVIIAPISGIPLATTGNIGIKTEGICDDIFIDVRNALVLGIEAVAVEHTANTPTPAIYRLESCAFLNIDQTLIKMNTTDGVQQIEVTLTAVRVDEASPNPTTGSTIFDCQSGIITATAQSIEAEHIAKVGAAGVLLFSANACFGDILVEDGGICRGRSIGLLIGDITVEAGGTLDTIINRHIGTVTNNGEINGLIGGVRYGNWLQPFGSMFQRDNVNATTINTIDVWEDVLNFLEGELEQTTLVSSVLTTELASTTYEISYSLCIVGFTGNTFETAIEVNGVIRDESVSCATIPSGGNPASTAGGLLLTIPAGQDVKLKIRNISNTQNVLVVHASVEMVGVR